MANSSGVGLQSKLNWRTIIKWIHENRRSRN